MHRRTAAQPRQRPSARQARQLQVPCQACYPHPWHKGPCRYCDCAKATILVLMAIVPKRGTASCFSVFDSRTNAAGELEVLPRGHFRAVLLTPIQMIILNSIESTVFIVVNDQRTKWWGFTSETDARRHMRDEKYAYRGEGAKIDIVACRFA